MTVEISPSAAPAKPTATTGAPANKVSAKGADKSNADAKSGFMNVLAAIDMGPESAQALADTVALTDGAVLQDKPVDDATLLLSQSLQWGATPSDAATNAPQATSATPLAGSAIPPSGVLASISQPALPGGSPARLRGRASDTATLQSSPVPDATNTSQKNERTESRGREVFAVEAAMHSVTVAEVAFAPLISALGKREEQKSERGVFKSGTVDGSASAMASPSWAGTEYTGSAAMDAGMGVDAFVAEKVSYWISNDVQNAEMKLDGLGDHPVEVSIRMHGNEAHVAFRTDEAMARDVLETASQSLKDMLQKEGVVLSGVSVGTSGSGDSGSQGRNPRQGGRQAGIFVEKPLGSDARLGGVRNAGQALDLFV